MIAHRVCLLRLYVICAILALPGAAIRLRGLRRIAAPLLAATALFTHSDQALSALQARPEYSRSVGTGIEYYDYKIGDGASPKVGDKVVFNYKGRLAGRQGWIYDDTFVEGADPIRVVLGKGACIPGLEIGLEGDGADMQPMRKGGKRRIVIPSKLGYTNKLQEPIPREYSQQQRLYSTVLNEVRDYHEKEALGDSIVGKLVLDVELLRVYPPR
jgi:FKBP-type peptidyl-prolyl cis-trans isomerase